MKSRRLVFALPTGLVAALAAQAAVWAQDGTGAAAGRVPRSTIGEIGAFMSQIREALPIGFSYSLNSPYTN